MNGITLPVNFNYKTGNNEITFIANILLPNFEAFSSLENMNDCCMAFHTGEDGIHQIWEELHLQMTSIVNPINL